MMNHWWVRPSILAGILCAALSQAAAQDLSATLAGCRAEMDDALRLACYDREVAKLNQQSTAAAAAPAAATPVVAPQTPEERFGYRGVIAREERDRDQQKARALPELVATVTAISTRGDGTLVVTLDNGQVWAQNRPDAFFKLKVGEQVKIEPAALKSFLLISPSKRTARVTRLK
jgi:hypothetical protein